MAESKGVFGFEYLEDAELEQNDVVGCTTALRVASPTLSGPIVFGPIVCDIPRMPTAPLGWG